MPLYSFKCSPEAIFQGVHVPMVTLEAEDLEVAAAILREVLPNPPFGAVNFTAVDEFASLAERSKMPDGLIVPAGYIMLFRFAADCWRRGAPEREFEDEFFRHKRRLDWEGNSAYLLGKRGKSVFEMAVPVYERPAASAT